jgi:hypothetical protein
VWRFEFWERWPGSGFRRYLTKTGKHQSKTKSGKSRIEHCQMKKKMKKCMHAFRKRTHRLAEETMQIVRCRYPCKTVQIEPPTIQAPSRDPHTMPLHCEELCQFSSTSTPDLVVTILDSNPSHTPEQPQAHMPYHSGHSNQAPCILPINQSLRRLPRLTPQGLTTLTRSVEPRSLELTGLPRIIAIGVRERRRVDLFAAARVARATGLSLWWVLVGRWTRAGWQCDAAVPARQSGLWDVVAVWARARLEED